MTVKACIPIIPSADIEKSLRDFRPGGEQSDLLIEQVLEGAIDQMHESRLFSGVPAVAAI